MHWFNNKTIIFVSIFILIAFASYIKMGKTRNSPNEIIEKNCDSQITDQNHYSRSPDGKTSADIIKVDGFLYDFVDLKKLDEYSETLIPLEDVFYNSIERTEWLDNSRYAICGNINPSLQVYILIDSEKRQITGKYYGLGFTWNKNKDKLYFIEPSPHFSTPLSDKIVDHENHVYFKTSNEETIINKLAISDDEQIFVFYIDDTKNQSRALVVARMDKNKILRKQAIIQAPLGDVEFIDHNSIKITESDGTSTYYKIN